MYTHRIRAAAVLTRPEGQILMVHHRHPVTGYQWLTPPGGGVDNGETLFQAAEREIWEECNLRCRGEELLYVVDWLDEVKLIHHLEAYVRVSYLSGQLKKGCDPEEQNQMIVACMYMDQQQLAHSPLPVYPVILRHRFWQDWRKGFAGRQIYLGREEWQQSD